MLRPTASLDTGGGRVSVPGVLHEARPTFFIPFVYGQLKPDSATSSWCCLETRDARLAAETLFQLDLSSTSSPGKSKVFPVRLDWVLAF